jgi:E3 ubiquitin-protein ligase MARCH6
VQTFFFFAKKSELLYIVSSLNAESRRLNVVILLPDVATLMLGYFTLAVTAFLWNIICCAYMRRVKDNGFQQRQPVQPPHLLPDALLNEENENIEPFRQQRSTGEMISATFQCAAAVAKVGLLLFLKMLFLPLLLGVCLDLATLTILQESVSSRITFAGGDLFGAISIHWVAGITFMLLVTVSVLQLREVVHPDLFARIIRPQVRNF